MSVTWWSTTRASVTSTVRFSTVPWSKSSSFRTPGQSLAHLKWFNSHSELCQVNNSSSRWAVQCWNLKSKEVRALSKKLRVAHPHFVAYFLVSKTPKTYDQSLTSITPRKNEFQSRTKFQSASRLVPQNLNSVNQLTVAWWPQLYLNSTSKITQRRSPKKSLFTSGTRLVRKIWLRLAIRKCSSTCTLCASIIPFSNSEKKRRYTWQMDSPSATKKAIKSKRSYEVRS